jgi:hypothetical protein
LEKRIGEACAIVENGVLIKISESQAIDQTQKLMVLLDPPAN